MKTDHAQILSLIVLATNMFLFGLGSFVCFDSLCPFNNLSVIKGWVFLG